MKLYMTLERRKWLPTKASISVQTPRGVLNLYTEGLRGVVRLRLLPGSIKDLPWESVPIDFCKPPPLGVIEWFLLHEGRSPVLSLGPDIAAIAKAFEYALRDAMHSPHR